MKKIIVAILIASILMVSGCIEENIEQKTGIECSDSLDEFWSYDDILDYTPEEYRDIVSTGSVQECLDYDLLNLGSRAVCEACGWICALDSTYFLRYTKDTVLEVYLWDVQCQGEALEFRLEVQGKKEGEVVFKNARKAWLGLPNPAAVYCEEQGGTVEIRNDPRPAGGQYGVCILENGTECDEWAYYRDGCESCLTYCQKQPHIQCVGHWNISGEYPDCNCEYVCD